MNFICQIAVQDIAVQDNGRTYITPEDVHEALDTHSADEVRLAVLEVLGGRIGFGAEDSGLCAFIAWRGTKRKKEEREDDDSYLG